MIGLLQRVSEASVTIDGNKIAQIDQGLLVLVGIEREDTSRHAEKLAEKILGYRVFADSEGKMNLSLMDIKGGLILVPQFTLPAATHKGLRPSFTPAAAPDKGRELFQELYKLIYQRYDKVQSGQFGSDMQVALINNGPVTFWLRVNSV